MDWYLLLQIFRQKDNAMRAYNHISRAWVIVWFVITVAGVLGIFLLLILPDTQVYQLSQYLTKPHKQPCLLCGMTSSLVFLKHGNWHESIQVHPGGTTLVLATFVSLTIGLWCWPRLLMRRSEKIKP